MYRLFCAKIHEYFKMTSQIVRLIVSYMRISENILLLLHRIQMLITMSCILNIETATNVCSVAVSQDGAVIFNKQELKGPSQSVSLGVFVDEAMSFIDSHAIPLDAVAVSCGPGSYTGLRIGVSMTKGICYGRNVPLIGITTLKILCVPLLLHHEELPEDALLCPMIDARRMEVYSAVYDRSLEELRKISADVIDENSYADYLNEHPVYFFGDGAAKCKDKIVHPNAHFIDNIVPLASMMFPLSEKAVAIEEYKDVAYFEPFYLKEFVATKPKKLL
jgi:tRNA threonylcarbamoyladenosine biosynthesis protein TsaB